MEINFEYTDTFCGEANYSWVKRGSFETARDTSDSAIVRRVKKELGLNGVRCKRDDLGDEIRLFPSGSCTVIFIYFS